MFLFSPLKHWYTKKNSPSWQSGKYWISECNSHPGLFVVTDCDTNKFHTVHSSIELMKTKYPLHENTKNKEAEKDLTRSYTRRRV